MVEESGGVANFELADPISQLHGKSLIREQRENLLRGGWAGLTDILPAPKHLFKCVTAEMQPWRR